MDMTKTRTAKETQMTKRFVAAVCGTVDRVCAFQYRAFSDWSMLHMDKRRLVFGVLAGLASITVACSGGDTPTAPSKTTDTMQFHRGSTDIEVSRGGAGKTAGPKDKRGHAGQKHSDGDRRRKFEYCKSLATGDKNYDRCQLWLEQIARKGPGDGNASKERRGAGKKRRVEYCKSLEAGHQDYQRCQDWLHSKRNGRGNRQK